MAALLSKSLGQLKSQDNPGGSRRTSGGESRGTPYARPERPAPVTGAWSHDMYGSASTDQETREDAGRRTSGGGGERKTEKLIITNLHYEVSERELELLFLQIGPLASGPSIKFDRSGRSTGSAYLGYTSVDDAARAKSAFDGALAKGQNITVKFDYRPSAPAPPAPGTLAARLAQPVVATQQRRERPNPLNINNVPGLNAPRDAPRAARGGSVRGGRGGGRGNVRGVGGAGGREKKTTSAEDLDKELEAFMGAPPPAKAAPVADVDMA